jgi:hypothetical protein
LGETPYPDGEAGGVPRLCAGARRFLCVDDNPAGGELVDVAAIGRIGLY